MARLKDHWVWKPQDADTRTIVQKQSVKKKPRKKKKYDNHKSDNFYKTDEWLKLRVRVLERYECKCMMCGRSPKEDGIKIHVDHIKPMSRFPELGLVFSNLQILCEDCNIGKGNRYKTDWRPGNIKSNQREQEAYDIDLINRCPF